MIPFIAASNFPRFSSPVCRCVDINKRRAVCDILLETKESTWKTTVEYAIVCADVFAKLNSAHMATPMPALVPTRDVSQSYYTSFGELQNIKTYSDSSFCEKWVTMSATLPPSNPSDFPGHFYDNHPAVPHSVMLLHNRDLIGKAIDKFCGFDLSFKERDLGQESDIRLVWSKVSKIILLGMIH